MSLTVPQFVRKAWRQPQQLWLRRAFFQVHLWSGLILSLYVVAIGISGSILVFKDELMPRPRVGSIAFDPGLCTPDRLLAAMRAAANSHLDQILSLAICPTEANNLYAITLHRRPPLGDSPTSLTVYVHPLTGLVVGEISEQSTWLSFVEKFHLDLLLRRNGRQWNGLGAAVLLLLVLSGLVLWWPGVRNWRRAFRIDFQRTWKRINWDLHSAIGIWTVFFTLAWAVTGIYFAWETPFERAINALSPVVTANYPEEELNRFAALPPSSATSTLHLEQVLKHSEGLSPEGKLEGLFFGSDPKPILTIYMARGHLGDYTKTDFIYFDQKTGQHLLTWHRGQNKSLGDWMLWLLVPLHFGTSWGLLGKIVWCSLGLVLPLLVLTGFLMYWNRWLRKTLRL